MPYFKAEISENAFRGLKIIERQLGGQPKDVTQLLAAALETLGNLLAFQEENKTRGDAVLVVRDEGNRRYYSHTSLNVIIPYHLLK